MCPRTHTHTHPPTHSPTHSPTHPPTHPHAHADTQMHAYINTYCMYINNNSINDNNNDNNNNRYVQLHVRWYCERIDLNPSVHELCRFVAFNTKWFHAVSASGHKGLPGCQGRFWAETSWSMRPWVQKECGRDLNQEVFVCLWRCCDILKHSPVFSLQHSSC